MEVLTVNVELSTAEREFYNSLLQKSQSLFEGFIKSGTASKSWFAIFSLLNRLRQTCDHVALTVKSHLDETEWNPDTLEAIDSPAKKKAASPLPAKRKRASKDKDALGEEVSVTVNVAPLRFIFPGLTRIFFFHSSWKGF
jgi:SNF2 family DNA or RNA helicase